MIAFRRGRIDANAPGAMVLLDHFNDVGGNNADAGRRQMERP